MSESAAEMNTRIDRDRLSITGNDSARQGMPRSDSHRSKRPPGFRQPLIFNRLARQRFAKDRIAALIKQLGRDPSYPERILIDRIVANQWKLLRHEAKMDSGEELSLHASRDYGAADNRLRLDLMALGLKPPAASSGGQTFDQWSHIAAMTGKKKGRP